MVSQQERDELMAAWRKEPMYVAGTVVKCAVCLLFLFGLVFIGVASEPLAERTAQSAPSHQGQVIARAKGIDTAPVRTAADRSAKPTVTRHVAFEKDRVFE